MSRVVRTVCMIMMGLTLILFIAGVAVTIIGSSNTLWSRKCFSPVGPYKIPFSQLTTASIILMEAFAALIMAVRMKGLYHLYKLFGHYSEGEIFTIGSVAQIRRLGVTFLLGAGVQVLVVPIHCIMAWQCGITPTFVIIAFAPSVLIPFAGGTNGVIESLYAAGLLILISWVMDVGRGLREDHELTI